MSRPARGRWQLGHLLGEDTLGTRWLATDGKDDVVLHEFRLGEVDPAELERGLQRLCGPWVGAAPPLLAPRLELSESPLVLLPFTPWVSFAELCRAAYLRGASPALALESVASLAEAAARSPDLLESFATDVTTSSVRVTFEGEVRAAPDPFRVVFGFGASVRFDSMVPPEQFDAGVAGPAAAVWKLGLLALHALEGTDPFGGEDEREWADRVFRGRPKVKPERRALWPAPLPPVLEAAVAPKPEARPSLAELRDALRSAAAPPAEALAWRSDLLKWARPGAERAQRQWLDAVHERPVEPLPPEIEAALVASPNDPQAWAVAADWLGEQGHPRAELAGLHRRLRAGGGDDEAEETKHLRELVEALHQREDLAPQLDAPGFDLVWGPHGWVDAVELSLPLTAWALETQLRHPGLRYLRTVRVVRAGATVESLVDALERVRPPLLERVEVPQLTLMHRTRLLDAFPRLALVVFPPPMPPRVPSRPLRVNLVPEPQPGLLGRLFGRLRGR